MTSFEKAEQPEIEAAIARQAEPMHQFHPELKLVDPEIPELGWERIAATELAPNVRHINRSRGGVQWLGPGITKPPYLRPDAPPDIAA